jgi:hypothetical protein
MTMHSPTTGTHIVYQVGTALGSGARSMLLPLLHSTKSFDFYFRVLTLSKKTRAN